RAVRGEPDLPLRRGQPRVIGGLVETMDERVARVVVRGRLVDGQDGGGHSTVTNPEPLRVAAEVEVPRHADVRDAADEIVLNLGNLVLVHRSTPTPGRSRRSRDLSGARAACAAPSPPAGAPAHG